MITNYKNIKLRTNFIKISASESKRIFRIIAIRLAHGFFEKGAICMLY